MTKIDKVYQQLVLKDKMLSAKQIRNLYKVKNPYDIIYRLRKEGWQIDMKNTKYVSR